MSLYLYDCWWLNEPPTTLQEAKPKKEGVSSEAEASPPPAKSDTFCQTAETTINKSLIEDLLGTFLLVQHFLCK